MSSFIFLLASTQGFRRLNTNRVPGSEIRIAAERFVLADRFHATGWVIAECLGVYLAAADRLGAR